MLTYDITFELVQPHVTDQLYKNQPYRTFRLCRPSSAVKTVLHGRNVLYIDFVQSVQEVTLYHKPCMQHNVADAAYMHG